MLLLETFLLFCNNYSTAFKLECIFYSPLNWYEENKAVLRVVLIFLFHAKMSYLFAVNVVGGLTNFCGHSLCLVPIVFTQSENAYKVQKLTRKYKILWQLLFSLSLFYTMLQIYFHQNVTSAYKLVPVLFHGFNLVTKVSVIVFLVAFHRNSFEFCYLLNILIRNKIETLESQNRYWFLVVVNPFLVSGIFICMCAVTMILPCYHYSLYATDLLTCNGLVFRIAVSFMDILFALPCAAIGSSMSTTCMFVLINISEWFEVLKTHSYLSTENDQIKKIRLNYQSLQILMELCNASLQTYVWPMYEFMGGIVMITLLYVQLAFKMAIHFSAKCTIFFCFLSSIFIVNAALQLAGVPYSKSKASLQKLRRQRLSLEDRKGVCMLKPVFLKIGDFHKIDRLRILALSKFVLQRTIFIVVKTKTTGLIDGVI